MSNEAKLGTVPKGDEGRDAVHVAIVPVRAAERLEGGSPVRLNSDGMAEACRAEDAIGVVDPFRPEEDRIVTMNTWFWLCLYPKTITGLRHVWEHPAFQHPEITPPPASHYTKEKLASEEWLKNYVKIHCPYDEEDGNIDDGYAAFLKHVTDDKWIYYYGNDCHSLSDVEDADELFRHLSIVLGKTITASYFEAFTCSC